MAAKTDITQERAAFEAWAENKGVPLHKVTPCDERDPYYADGWGAAAWSAWQARAAVEADRQRRGEPVAYRLLRKNADGDWVTDGRPWCDGIPDGDLVRDSAKSGQYRIEYAYAAPVAAQAQPVVNRQMTTAVDQSFVNMTPGTAVQVDGSSDSQDQPSAQDREDVNALVAAEYSRWIRAHASGQSYDDFLADEVAARAAKGE